MHPVLFRIGALLIPSYGAVAAIGVLLALLLAQRTARIVRIAPNQVWNLCVVALFAALLGSRILLVAMNWRDLLHHPLWMLGLATIHHPLLAAAAALFGVIAAFAFGRWQRMPWRSTADALAGPLFLGMACEQFGELLAGSSFGKGTLMPWAVIYNDPLAYRWSGSPLGIPLHPVQAYAAIGFLTLSILLIVWLPARRQAGDVAGIGLMGGGTVLYATEFWRDWEGRGSAFRGLLDGPQVAAVLFVIAGAFLLRERKQVQRSESPGSLTTRSFEVHHD